MPITINVPGQGVAEFPDEIGYDKAFEAVQADFPDWKPSREDQFNFLRHNVESKAPDDERRYAASIGEPYNEGKITPYERALAVGASAVEGLSRFIPSTIGALGSMESAVDVIGRRIGKPSDALPGMGARDFSEDSLGETVARTGTTTDTFKSLKSDVEGAIKERFPVDPRAQEGWTGALTTGVASGVGQLASQLALARATKSPIGANLIATGLGTAMEVTDAYDREIERQQRVGEPIDELKAAAKSGAYGIVAGILESKLGAGALAERIAKLGEGAVESIFRSGLRNFAKGGLDEASERIAQDLIVEGKVGWEDVAKEGVVGGIVQGGAGLAIDSANKAKAAEDKIQQDIFNEKYSNLLAAQAKRTNLDQAREASANELAAMVGVEAPHVEPIQKPARLAQPISDVESDSGFFSAEQSGGPGLVQMMRESQKKQGRSDVESGLVGPATSYLPEYAGQISEQASTSGVGESVPQGGDTPVDQFLRSSLSNKASTPDANAFDITAETTPVDAAVMGSNPQRSLPPMREDQQRVLDTAYQTLVSLEDPKSKPDMSLVLQLEQVAPTIKRLVDSRIDQAIQVNAKDSDIGPLIDLQSKLKSFTDDLIARRQLSDESQPQISTADKIYNKLDEWDKGLNNEIRSSVFLGLEVGVAKVVLKTAKLAIRAGQSVSDAIKTAIEKARVDFPRAQFNDEALRKEMLSELQGFITGDEQSQSIAQAAQPVVERNESAAAQLDTSRYNNEGYKAANRTLQDLRDRAIQAALALDQPASVVPTNVMSDEFADAAETLGIDPDQIKELQSAINFEDRAKELASLITQRDSYIASQSSLSKASGSKYKDTIKFFQDAVAKVSQKIGAPKYADVQSRASEILSLRANRVDLEAKKRSLQNENVRNALVGPVEELRNLMEENPEMLDKGVQDFIEDPTVDDEIKQVVIIRMSNLFRKFDMYQQNVEDLLTSRRASLERTIAKLTGQLREKEMEKAYADIVMDDARRALSGESVVGGLNPDWLEWFDKNQSAVRSFARMLSKRVGESDPQALAMLDWITSNPEGAPPAIRNLGAESNWGVGDDALNSIIDTLKQSPPIRQAIAAIYEGGSETLPAHELREIATAALGDDKDYANQLYDSLVKRTQNERRKLAARVNTLRKELEEARIEIGALQEASKMFTEVAESPVFKDARMSVESSSDSFQKQFLISKNDGLALKGFKIPGAEGQNEVVVAASESGEIDFTQKKAAEIKEWYDNAAAYVSAYEMVLNDYSMDQSNKTPLEEGFDPAVYRGLKVALATEVPILLDPVNFNPDLGLSQNTPVNLMLNSADWFRQLDANAKLVEGIFGSNYKAKIASYRNTRLVLDRAMNDVRFKQMPSLLSAAMASHPSVGGKNWLDRLMNKSKVVSGFTGASGNMEMYRKLVFNPMAHEGRMFGGNLRVGMTLPTGEVVTEADMELLRRSMDFSKELLKIAQSESKGTEVEVGGKVYRRKAGSVGDYGTPRHINQDGVEAMKRIATAYSKNDPDQKFDAQNLDTHPIAELWNTLANQYNALTYHVLDSAYRTDRDISVTPLMRQAYRSLAGELEDANFSNKIASIQDLVARIRFHFPDGSGYDSRQYVIEQLNAELGQYAANSRSQTDARAKSEDEKLRDIAEGKESNRTKSASMIETETSNNEFTKPAGKLIIPSVFYDYSSITPVEMKLASSRAVSERVVDLKTAMRVASDSVQAMIIRANSTPDDPGVKSMLSKIAPDQSQAVAVLEKIRDSLNSLDDDIGRDYRRSNAVWNAMMKGASIGVAGALTSPPAQVGNILSSAMAAFTFHSQVDRRAALSIGALTIGHMAKVSAKGAARLMERIGGLPLRVAYRRLAKNHPELAESIRNEYGKVYAAIGLKDADEVRRLGLSQTEGFFRTWQNAVKEAAQYATSEEQRRFSGATGSLSKAARIGTAAVLAPLKSTFKIIGLEATDLYANMQGLTSFRIIEKQWKDLAKTWGSDRAKQLGGSYDPSNPAWLVTADEYVSGIATGPAKENRLAQARLMANAAGTTLEDVLWSYYTRSEGGLKSASLFGEFEDSAKRYVIGQVNASIYTNRPQKAQSNPEQATLQILQGYASNMANQLAQAMRNVKSIPKMRRLLEDFGKILMAFVIASIVGSLVGTARDIWARWMMGRLDRKMTPADPEFWKQDAGLPWRIAKQAFSMLPGGQTVVSIGDFSRGSTASGFFVFSLADRILNYVRGVKDLPAEDLGWLANKARREMVPGSEPLVNHTTDNPSRKIMSATAAYSSAAHQADLVKPGIFATGGPAPITAKSGILGRMNEAAMDATVKVQRGDTEGAAQATLEVSKQKDRLVDYHRKQIAENNQRRGIEQSESEVEKDANAAARRDWQELNPISRALGHQPTESELAAINANLSGDRRKSADLGWAAYSSMAELFPDSKGRTTEPQQQRREARRRGSSFGYSGATLLGARRGGRSRRVGRSRASSYGRGRSRSRRGARRVRLR